MDSARTSSAVEPIGSFRDIEYRELFDKIQKQILSRTASRNKTCGDIEDVFNRYANSTSHVLSVNHLHGALHDLGCDDVEHINLLLTLDGKFQSGLDINEFKRIVESPTSLEQIVRTMPVWKLISDAIPRKHTNEQSAQDSLSMLASLAPEDINCMVDAMTDGLKVLLSGFCCDLKKQKEFCESSMTVGGSKFSIDSYNAGGIRHFHDGLEGRVGETVIVVKSGICLKCFVSRNRATRYAFRRSHAKGALQQGWL